MTTTATLNSTDITPTKDRTGLLVLVALLAASIEPVLVRLGYRGNATTTQLWFARAIMAALVVVPIAGSLRRITKTQFKAILGVGPLLLVTNLSKMIALKTVPVALAVTAMSTTPAFVAIGGIILGRDKTSLKFWFGFACCLIGIVLSVDLASIKLQSGYTFGILLVACCMISSTVYRLRLEGLTKIVEPQVASTWFFAVNGLVTLALLPICVQVDDAADTIAWIQHFPPRVFYIAAWSGVAAVGANILFVKAVKALGATRMSIFDLLQRPLVVLFAAAILGESLNWSQAVGFVLVMIGVRYAKVVRIPQAKN